MTSPRRKCSFVDIPVACERSLFPLRCSAQGLLRDLWLHQACVSAISYFSERWELGGLHIWGTQAVATAKYRKLEEKRTQEHNKVPSWRQVGNLENAAGVCATWDSACHQASVQEWSTKPTHLRVSCCAGPGEPKFNHICSIQPRGETDCT